MPLINGTEGDDTLYGTSDGEEINGLGGDDTWMAGLVTIRSTGMRAPIR